MRRLVSLLALLAVSACAPADGSTPAEAEAPVPAAPNAPSNTLAERLPQTVDGHDRQSLDVSTDGALGAQVTRATATYGDPPTVTLALTDFGTIEMAEMMGHGWALAPGVDQLDGMPVQRDSSASTVRLLTDGRTLAEATAPTLAEAERALHAVR